MGWAPAAEADEEDNRRDSGTRPCDVHTCAVVLVRVSEGIALASGIAVPHCPKIGSVSAEASNAWPLCLTLPFPADRSTRRPATMASPGSSTVRCNTPDLVEPTFRTKPFADHVPWGFLRGDCGGIADLCPQITHLLELTLAIGNRYLIAAIAVLGLPWRGAGLCPMMPGTVPKRAAVFLSDAAWHPS